MKCGLLGRKLGHSYSPQIHRHLGDYSYDLFEKEPEQLQQFLTDGNFTGLNVTIPYKKDVIPYCMELTEVARRLGAVNTIVRKADGSLTGHNTDYFGFKTMLQSSGVCVNGKKVLVLGTGGTSNTVCAVLQDQGAKVVVISRSGENNYTNLHLHADASVIVNTTPVGMFPETGVAPLSLSGFNALEAVLDVIYNPAKTQLLLDAEELGIKTANGLIMLVAQACESAQWFTGKKVDMDKIQKIHSDLRQITENIVLIGMPGCGKSTIAAVLSQLTGKKAVDADVCIEQAAGKSISQIFREDGESHFRALETQVLSELGKQSNLIIATGGGCVTRPENDPLLHQNATIFWIQRRLDSLSTEGRPLMKTTNAYQMYETRQPLYQRFADYTVENNGLPEDAAKQILKLWEEMT